MKIVTLEEHYADQGILDANSVYNANRPPMTPEQEEAMKFLMSRAYPGPQLLDFEERLRFMDENRIDVQILSMTGAVSNQAPAKDAVRIARMANDVTKKHVDEHPDRFLGFATLPMADPKAAADELERCVKELGFVGALLAGKYNDRFYNEAEFFPVFEKAAELDVPIYFHPAYIPMEVQEAYYKSEAYSYIVASEFASAGYGWHSEVGIHIVRMILSGIFDALPGLKFISGHWGETIPAFFDRMDSILDREITGLKKNISEYYKEHVYITPSGILSNDQLEYIVKVMGADHVMYAVDYPYVLPENIYDFIAKSSLTEEEKELIAYRNAERIFHRTF